MITYIENAQLLQNACVGVMVVFRMMLFRKSDWLDVDEDNEGEAKDPVRHVADNVIEVGKHAEGFWAPECISYD